MKYLIEIKTIEEISDKTYPKSETIFAQYVEDLNVKAVIAVVNDLLTKEDKGV